MRLFLHLVLLFNFLIPAVSAAGSVYSNLSVSQHSYWLKLLHYHNGKSRADGENFFISPLGKINPEAELEATIASFANPKAESGWFHYHPQCVFRERFNILKKWGLLNDIQEMACPMFDEWKAGLNAESITLIFSTSYPNNPSSLFGHTLIRLNQKNKTNDLLDYAVAFSAIPQHDDIGVVFALKGLFGGYKGLLEVTKYYTKVNEYNNGESRDLIEYDINMTKDELDRLINHLWEIYQTTYFDYYFADENCSAVLVDILAVPFENDDINSHDRWYYLPSEMIKKFKKIPGRIKSENFRPSLKKQLEKKISGLSSNEKEEIKRIANGHDFPMNTNSIPVIDGVISLLDFTHYRTKEILSGDQKQVFRKALLKRSSLAQDTNTSKPIYDQNNRPDLGHEPQKMSFFTRTENSHFQLGIEFKEGYHDLMSNDQGYDPFSQFDFFTGSLLYDKKLKNLNYDQLVFVNLVSLHQYTFFDPQFSWAAKLGADRVFDLNCFDKNKICHKAEARAYGGPTIKPSSSLALNFLGGAFTEASNSMDRGFRAGLGFEASALYQFSDRMKWGIFDEIRFDAIGRIQKDYYNNLSVKQSYFSSTNTEWRFESKWVSKFKSFSINTKIFQLNYGFFF